MVNLLRYIIIISKTLNQKGHADHLNWLDPGSLNHLCDQCLMCCEPLCWIIRIDRSRQLEQLFQHLQRVLGPLDGVSNCPFITEDLVVIAGGETFVAKEVDVFVFDTRYFFFCLDVS